MKATILPFSFFLSFFFSQSSVGQNTYQFGLDLKLISSTQLLRFPQKANEGTFQGNNLNSVGFGVFAKKDLNKSGTISALLKLNYIRKGFRLPTQYGEIGTDIYFEFDQRNIFHFLDLDALVQFKFHNKFLPLVNAGVRIGALLQSKIGSYYKPFINFDSYPRQLHDFNSVSGAWVFGFSYKLTKEIGLGLETSIEMLPTINRKDFIAKNWVSALNVTYFF